MSQAKRTRSVREPVSAIAAAIACVLLLSGCASDPLAEQYRAGSGKNYIAGDGSVTEIVPENRSDAVVFEGVDESGGTISSRELLGEVIVVNFWYAGCAPCRAEAPVLEEAFEDSASTGVAFVGVNVRDQAETAQTFNAEFGVTYSSIIDTNGQAQLAFATNVPPNAVPTTLVLDRQGRVAARILGQLKNASILTTIISDVAAETN
jgi:thiol-disulfide isomerase/thioredoxin